MPTAFPESSLTAASRIGRRRSNVGAYGAASWLLFFGSFHLRWLLAGQILVSFVAAVDSGLVLNDFIRHFEPLFYDRSNLQKQHDRVKRAVSSSASFPSSFAARTSSSAVGGDVRLEFTAHNRIFKVRLKPDSHSVFAPDAVFETTGGDLIPFDLERVYGGHLEDDEDAEVSGILTKDGLFDGTILTNNEVYYVEPASRYLKSADVDFHSVIYKESDVEPPSSFHAGRRLSSGAPRNRRSADGFSTYGSSSDKNLKDAMSTRRQDVEASRLEWDAEAAAAAGDDRNGTGFSPALVRHGDAAEYRGGGPGTVWINYEDAMTRRDVGLGFGGGGGLGSLGNGLAGEDSVSSDLLVHYMRPGVDEFRYRRKPVYPKQKKYDPTKTTCMLYLQADHLFYNMMGSEEACIESMTRHVQRVNSIYETTDFDEDEKPDHVSFMIKRIKVHTNEAMNEADYRYPGNYGVEKFLELFSEEDYDSFCLAYMFTYRDFEGGTLGLAWTGDLKNAGGVCERNGHYRGSLKSLNTGIITLLNYGKRVPPAVSHVTLAHEIGHNFGSPHDPEHDKLCTPGGHDGNYIMFARATSGDKRNNKKFSPCSIKAINGVLNEKARGKNGCFEEPATAICGNGVVEAGEDCDCGWEEDCLEDCCWPMRKDPSPLQKPCTLKPYKICSPSQGPCCTGDCRLQIGNRCRDDNGCRDASYCDGRSAHCPASANKPNKTVCNDEFVCFKGECTGSICTAYGLESCQCLRGPLDPATKSCELCCKLPGPDGACLSSFDWNIPPYDVPDMYAKPGTPCDNYNGYCDVFQKCREVDPSGPLSTLRKLILSDESIASLRRWASEHWYGVLFIILGFLVLLIGIAKIFGRSNLVYWKKITVYHGSSRGGENKTRKLQTAIAAAASNDRLTVHPTVVRTKLPLRKKVRERGARKRKASSPKKNASTLAVTLSPAAAALSASARHGRKVVLFGRGRLKASGSAFAAAAVTTTTTSGGPGPVHKPKTKKLSSSPTKKTSSSSPKKSSSIVASRGRSLLSRRGGAGSKGGGLTTSAAAASSNGSGEADNRLSGFVNSSFEPVQVAASEAVPASNSSTPPPLPPRNPPGGDASLNVKSNFNTGSAALASDETAVAAGAAAAEDSPPPQHPSSPAGKSSGSQSGAAAADADVAAAAGRGGNCVETSSSADRIFQVSAGDTDDDNDEDDNEGVDVGGSVSTFDRIKSRSFSPEKVRKKKIPGGLKTSLNHGRSRYHTTRLWDSSAGADPPLASRSAALCRPSRPYSDIILDIEPDPEPLLGRFEQVRGLKWSPTNFLLSNRKHKSRDGEFGFGAGSGPSASTLNLLGGDAGATSPGRRKSAAADKLLGPGRGGKHHQHPHQLHHHHQPHQHQLHHSGKSRGPTAAVGQGAVAGSQRKRDRQTDGKSGKHKARPKSKLTIKYENEVRPPNAYRRQASAPALFLQNPTTEHGWKGATTAGSKPAVPEAPLPPPSSSDAPAVLARNASHAEKREKYSYSRQSSAPTQTSGAGAGGVVSGGSRRTASSAALAAAHDDPRAWRKSESFHVTQTRSPPCPSSPSAAVVSPPFSPAAAASPSDGFAATDWTDAVLNLTSSSSAATSGVVDAGCRAMILPRVDLSPSSSSLSKSKSNAAGDAAKSKPSSASVSSSSSAASGRPAAAAATAARFRSFDDLETLWTSAAPAEEPRPSRDGNDDDDVDQPPSSCVSGQPSPSAPAREVPAVDWAECPSAPAVPAPVFGGAARTNKAKRLVKRRDRKRSTTSKTAVLASESPASSDPDVPGSDAEGD